MKGVEPAPSETDLSFIGKNSEGMEVYEMTVTSTTGNSFDVVPYTAGANAANIKLYADEYTPKALAASVLESPVTVYADVDGTDNSAVDFVALVGSDVTGSNHIVVGQTGTLTVYLSEIGTVKIGDLTTTRGNTASQITKDGETLYKYTTTAGAYTAPTDGSGEGGSQFDRLTIYLDGGAVGSYEVPVYGITYTSGTSGNVTSTSTANIRELYTSWPGLRGGEINWTRANAASAVLKD